MKSAFLILACFCAIAFVIFPAGALTIKSLTVDVGENGDADVNLWYELSLTEQAAVLFQVTDLRGTLERDLQENLNRPVSVREAGMNSADMTITGFASVRQQDGNRIMTTPGFSLAGAESVMKQYWYAPLTSPDFSPDVTEINFPDGYTEYYYNEISIPSITRTL
jgi:hypothetical protein